MAQSGYTPILIYGSGTASAVPTAGNLTSSSNGAELALNYADGKLYYKNSAGIVTLLSDKSAVSVTSANGFSGTVSQATATSTPAITLSTTITGVLKGNGTAISAAVSGTDYAPATSGTSILYGNGSGGFSNVTIGSGISFAGGTLSATGSGGTVTSVSGTGTVQGLTLTGTVTSSGSLTLGGSLSAVSLTSQVSGTLPVANGGTGVTSSTGSGSVVLSTSPSLTTPVLGTPTSGTLSNCTVDGTDAVGFRNIPQNVQTGSYTLVAADSGKHIYRDSGTAATWTIPANSSVAYAIGTALTFINLSSTSVSIAITSDTMYLSSAGTTGTRTLAQYGSATAVKIASTTWIISGSGLT